MLVLPHLTPETPVNEDGASITIAEQVSPFDLPVKTPFHPTDLAEAGAHPEFAKMRNLCSWWLRRAMGDGSYEDVEVCGSAQR